MSMSAGSFYISTTAQIAPSVITSVSGNLALIQDINMDAGAAASFDFTSVPYYDSYMLIYQGCTAGNLKTLAIRFNNDSGGNYYPHYLKQQGAVITGLAQNTQTSIMLSDVTYGNPNALLAQVLISGRANQYKEIIAHAAQGVNIHMICSGQWYNTADITRITVFLTDASNFTQYSDCKLYGVA